MDNIALYLLEMAVKIFTDGKLVDFAKELVATQMDNDLTNEEKHDNVIADLKTFTTEFSGTVLDIIVKVVLLVLRAKIEEQADGN